MIHKVECACCGRKGRVIILGKKERIFSRWWFFGCYKFSWGQGEYWECPKCKTIGMNCT